jgi:hypothetical protein
MPDVWEQQPPASGVTCGNVGPESGLLDNKQGRPLTVCVPLGPGCGAAAAATVGNADAFIVSNRDFQALRFAKSPPTKNKTRVNGFLQRIGILMG